MTISAKLSDVAGLKYAVSDPTDTDDVGGFSDPIQSVSAKTAKFSDTTTMKANAGLKIGITQLKIIATGAVPPARSEVAADFMNFPANGNTVDNDETTFSQYVLGNPPLTVTPEAVIDYGSIAVRDIKLVTRMFANKLNFNGGTQSFVYQISDDNITYIDPVTSNPIFQINSVPPGSGLRDTGITTYNDANSQSFRYVKITIIFTGTSQSGFNFTWQIYQVTVQNLGANQAVVNVRSSDNINTANGTILLNGVIINELQTLTFNSSLLLTGLGKYVTLEIVSLTSFDIPITLSEITTVKEV